MALLNSSDTLSDDGSTTQLTWDGRFVGHIGAYGTFGGGTLTLEYSLDNGSNWRTVDSTNLAFTADGNGNFELPDCLLRATLSGSTSPDLDVDIKPVSAISQ